MTNTKFTMKLAEQQASEIVNKNPDLDLAGQAALFSYRFNCSEKIALAIVSAVKENHTASEDQLAEIMTLMKTMIEEIDLRKTRRQLRKLIKRKTKNMLDILN